jgi:hypothetical protein
MPVRALCRYTKLGPEFPASLANLEVVVLDSVDVEMALTVPGATDEPVRRTLRKTAQLSGNRICVSVTAVEGEDIKQALLTELARFIYRAASIASERVEAPTCGGPLGGSAHNLAECLGEFAMVGLDSRDTWLRRHELSAPLDTEEWGFCASTAADELDMAAARDVVSSNNTSDSDKDDPKYLVTPRRKFNRNSDNVKKPEGFDPAAAFENILVQQGLTPELGEYRTPDKPTVFLTDPVVMDTPPPRAPPPARDEPRTGEDDGVAGPTAARTPSGRFVEGTTTSEPTSSGDAQRTTTVESTDDSEEDSGLWPPLSSQGRVDGMPPSSTGSRDDVRTGASRRVIDSGVAGGWIAGMSPEFDSPEMTIDIDSIPESLLPPLDHAAMTSIVAAAGASAVGRAGEACVYQHLSRLASDGSLAPELSVNDSYGETLIGAWTVEWLNADKESGAPFDLVCTLHGSDDGGADPIQIFVEVKSTSGEDKARFEISAQEIEHMQRNPHRSVIARVYNVVPPYDRLRLRFVQRPWERAMQKAVRLEMII